MRPWRRLQPALSTTGWSTWWSVPGHDPRRSAVTLHAQPGLTTWIQLDERSGGFFAVGQARRTGRPSVLVCTSGTAAANYLPAVVEAHHAGVPMVVCTADRPPELRGWGAGQTIDQVGIYGAATRWSVDLPVAGEWNGAQARIAAHRAVVASTGVDPGPVHLNWPLREPLEPVGEVPVVEPRPAADRARPPSVPAARELSARAKGVVIVGPDAVPGIDGQREVAAAALELGARAGWPVIGEPIAGTRRSAAGPGAIRIAHADHLLKVDELAAELAPELVVRLGGSPTTKPVRRWLERHRPETVLLVDPAHRWNDASFTVTDHLAGDPRDVLALLAEPADGDRTAWSDRWTEVEQAAARAVDEVIGEGPLLSASVARSLASAAPAGTLVMTSNSMPVRELDSFVPIEGPAVDFVGNRGASGIDGITSTALGLASRHDGPVVLFTGDLALLHDLGALFAAARAGLHLTAVCIDNDGGGIFSMLPIAQRDDVDFETLFRTPHGLDLRGFDGLGGVRVNRVESRAELDSELGRATAATEPGVDLLLVPVDRDADVAQHRAITAAVRAAVS